MLIYMCLMRVIRKNVSGNKTRIFGMHQIKPKHVKLKLELFFSWQFWNFIFLVFFRLKFWENVVINLCPPGVIIKTVSSNQKRIFRLHQIRPKEVKFKFKLIFYDIFIFIFWAFFRLIFLENMAIYLCLLRVNRKTVSGNKKEMRINQKRTKEVKLKH